jgi:Tfp pilus assembly protein PilF
MKRQNLLRIPALVGAIALLGCVQPEERVVSSQRKPSWKDADAAALTAARDLPPPKIRPETHVAAAKLFEGQGNIGQAITQYRKALAVDPECVEAHCGLGVLLGKIRRHAEAEASLQAAVTLRPRSPALRNNLGYEYMLQERWTDAEAELRNAIRLQPDYRRAHVNLGVALCKQGLFDDGLAEFEAVLSEGDAFYNLGLMYRAAGRYREASVALAYTLTIAPGMNAARVQLDQLTKRLRATGTPQPVPDYRAAGTPAPASIGYVPSPAAPSVPPVETELAVRPMMLTGSEPDSSGHQPMDEAVTAESSATPIPAAEPPPSNTPVNELEDWTPTELIGIDPASPAIDESVAEPPLDAAAGESPSVSEMESAEPWDESSAPAVTPDVSVTPDPIIAPDTTAIPEGDDEADTDAVPANAPSDDDAELIGAPLDAPADTGAMEPPPDITAPLAPAEVQPAPAEEEEVEPLVGDDGVAEMMEMVRTDSPARGIVPPDEPSAAEKSSAVETPSAVEELPTVEEPSIVEETDGPVLAMIDVQAAPWTELNTGAETGGRLPAGDDDSANPLRVSEEVLDNWWLRLSQGTRATLTALEAWIDACAQQWPAAAPANDMNRLDEPPPESTQGTVIAEPMPIEGDLAAEADGGPLADQPTEEPNPP